MEEGCSLGDVVRWESSQGELSLGEKFLLGAVLRRSYQVGVVPGGVVLRWSFPWGKLSTGGVVFRGSCQVHLVIWNYSNKLLLLTTRINTK